MSAERIWANSTVAGLLLLAALLIFPNLDDRYLWDDEAETALLAKNVLRFGVPVAWDGVSLISQECGSDYDVNYLWRQTPWLPIYLTAASFALLDAGTFTARLPCVSSCSDGARTSRCSGFSRFPRCTSWHDGCSPTD